VVHGKRLQAALENGWGVPIAPLAKAIGVTPPSIYNAIKAGEIEAYEVGRSKRVTPAAARRLLCIPAEAVEG
jgi:hypothetical protein